MLLDLVFDVMEADGDEACLALVRAGAGVPGLVELIEGAFAADEAVALAHGLAELGRHQEARDVLAAVIAAVPRSGPVHTVRGLGPLQVVCGLGPQGTQVQRGWSLGAPAEG